MSTKPIPSYAQDLWAASVANSFSVIMLFQGCLYSSLLCSCPEWFFFPFSFFGGFSHIGLFSCHLPLSPIKQRLVCYELLTNCSVTPGIVLRNPEKLQVRRGTQAPREQKRGATEDKEFGHGKEWVSLALPRISELQQMKLGCRKGVWQQLFPSFLLHFPTIHILIKSWKEYHLSLKRNSTSFCWYESLQLSLSLEKSSQYSSVGSVQPPLSRLLGTH